MSTVVDLRKTDDPRDAIHRAVHLLAEGHIVAFPTETVYAACVHALLTEAVQKLLASAGKPGISSDLGRSRVFKRRSITFPTWTDLASDWRGAAGPVP